jgi:hypothetical protein
MKPLLNWPRKVLGVILLQGFEKRMLILVASESPRRSKPLPPQFLAERGHGFVSPMSGRKLTI